MNTKIYYTVEEKIVGKWRSYYITSSHSKAKDKAEKRFNDIKVPIRIIVTHRDANQHFILEELRPANNG